MVDEHSKGNSISKLIIGAASACVWRGDEILLAQRGKALGYGLWSLPGGKIERGESAQHASIRELFEECGVIADLHRHVADYEIDAGDFSYVISCFTGVLVSGEAVAASDVSQVVWVHWQELAKFNLAPHTAEAVAIARDLTSV